MPAHAPRAPEREPGQLLRPVKVVPHAPQVHLDAAETRVGDDLRHPGRLPPAVDEQVLPPRVPPRHRQSAAAARAARPSRSRTTTTRRRGPGAPSPRASSSGAGGGRELVDEATLGDLGERAHDEDAPRGEVAAGDLDGVVGEREAKTVLVGDEVRPAEAPVDVRLGHEEIDVAGLGSSRRASSGNSYSPPRSATPTPLPRCLVPGLVVEHPRPAVGGQRDLAVPSAWRRASPWSPSIAARTATPCSPTRTRNCHSTPSWWMRCSTVPACS